MRKDEGSLIQYILSVIVILICALLIAYAVSIKIVQSQKMEVEDAITSSALASAIIDLNEYGTYKFIRSNNGRGRGSLADSKNEWGSAEDNLLNIFKENLAKNLNAREVNGRIYANDTSIIDGEIIVTKFWVYNKELVDVIECPNCKQESRITSDKCSGCNYTFPANKEPLKIQVKDYKGRWVPKHTETENFYIYKFESPSGAGFSKTVERINTSNGANKVYTPHDNNIINNSGTDGAGGGYVEVNNMTIYATVEFYITPFGANINEWGIYGGNEDDSINTPEKIKVTKSVVVDVQPTEP